MIEPGQQIELSIEKPAAGGRMLARHHGQVVLVQAAIPGERVIARVERVERQLAFATTIDVIEASADRRETETDLLCGGCLYAHISCERQRTLKGEVIRDAFARVGRIPLDRNIDVAPSPERAYRMRARLHVKNVRVGFYREGTHELCDAAASGQLGADAIVAAERAVDSLASAGHAVSSVEVTENLAADQRVIHATAAAGATMTDAALDAAVAAAGLTGCTGRTSDGVLRTAGVPVVTDPLSALTNGRATEGVLQRHAESFFQANRFLLPALVTDVIDAILPAGDVLDLYAGVGLFSIALAATGRSAITAVEGDRVSGSDLQRNAVPYDGRVRPVLTSVEDFLKRKTGRAAATIIVDPPRTGMSRAAMESIAASEAPRVVYVSCDPPTMARDARRLLDAGYRLESLRGFDLFPNTPHVESVGVFQL
jgi:tRNA/tmRNA/rRNA uracil-C5-methylase (TrmA/RlmC/RlmD family)